MEFPITVEAVTYEEPDTPIRKGLLGFEEPGSWVSVRPVGDDKTYIGIMLGDYFPPTLKFDSSTNTIILGEKVFGNPAIWVPELKKVIMGWSCWWGVVNSEDDLRQITDEDIQNQWYIKALKQMFAEKDKTDE